jgi:hypothetical protein
VLEENFTPYGWCVSEKMSWAAKRQTTRVEDMAYCLLGLFEINMPLLYGEGPNAFMRLQEEIIRKVTDESISPGTLLAEAWAYWLDLQITSTVQTCTVWKASCPYKLVLGLSLMEVLR